MTPHAKPLPPPAPALPPAPGPCDAELAARAQAGDAAAFELIMRRHNRRLFRLARSLVPDAAEAEDVLQEAYVRAFARLADLAHGEALPAWLARIVTNEALGRRRAAARVIPFAGWRPQGSGEEDEGVDDGPASEQPDPERLAASGELRRLLEAAVDALPEDFRTVFVLREVEGLSTAEVAACLAIRPETVKTRLHRARRLLQEKLGEQLLPLSPALFAFQGARCDRLVARVLTRLGPPAAADAPVPVLPPPTTPPRRWLGRLLAFLDPRRKR